MFNIIMYFLNDKIKWKIQNFDYFVFSSINVLYILVNNINSSPQPIAKTLVYIIRLLYFHLSYSCGMSQLLLLQIVDLALELAVISVWEVWGVQFVLEPKLLHESPKLRYLLTRPLLVAWTHCEVERNQLKTITGHQLQ